MNLELPPRARRIQGFLFTIDVVAGTTSACAENTEYLPNCEPFAWNYLRVRGEYDQQGLVHRGVMELPPRARRIPFSKRLWTPRVWNYLRVRGEYIYLNLLGVVKAELPPRARRILPPPSVGVFTFGTTSACAENTAHPLDAARLIRNYLRVRGEYFR